ncbi:hypothetical protein GYMLUDRAFT_57660 [Collybiopsis luxurians FD-317 M1]|uniref:Uncharacterized protein n=1 Tax=Collybiopsis luxurians FD-317 M1 TaxID=944289 RepID=A0A0D0BHN0_9AGAR|nr:hypothetical protein GYMLUDRAFT_57660 [Collybiopsis luxurians FD-317 M1]
MTMQWAQYTSSAEVTRKLLQLDEPCMVLKNRCCAGHGPPRQPRPQPSVFLTGPFTTAPSSMSAWLQDIPPYAMSTTCNVCRGNMYKCMSLLQAPPILAFAVDRMDGFDIDSVLTAVINREQVSYHLKGLAYYSHEQAHYMSRFIDNQGCVYCQ